MFRADIRVFCPVTVRIWVRVTAHSMQRCIKGKFIALFMSIITLETVLHSVDLVSTRSPINITLFNFTVY